MDSRVTRSPITRPALPRTSSAASGFFFCGMMLLPAATASRSSTNPNSAVAHRTISPASRDRWTISVAAADTNSTAKSRSAVASRLFSHSEENPNRSATSWGSIG